MFLNQSCAQTTLIILKIGRPNNDIPGFNNIVGIKTFRQQAIASIDVFADNLSIT